MKRHALRRRHAATRRGHASARGLKIGDVIQEWTPDEGEPDELMAYIQVAATLKGRPIKLGTMIGVPKYMHGTARAAGGDSVRPYLSTWWADASDWQDVSSNEREAVEEALAKAAPRLWRQVEKMRGA